MHEQKLGLVPSVEELRDAVHVAITPAFAGEDLEPGAHVELDTIAMKATPLQLGNRGVGIADPFRTETIKKGSRLWICMYPGSISSLRHDWTHPAFEASSLSRVATERLKSFADEIDVTYEDLMANAREHVDSGEYWSEGPKFDGVYTPDDFWDLYQAATGQSVPEKRQGNFFSCSC